MSEIKMLPLPEDAVEWLRQYGVANTAFQMEVIEGWFQAHARAVAEHNVAERDAEIEALRSERQAFFDQACKQADQCRSAESRAERLAEALREIESVAQGYVKDVASDYLRDHDQEGKDG